MRIEELSLTQLLVLRRAIKSARITDFSCFDIEDYCRNTEMVTGEDLMPAAWAYANFVYDRCGATTLTLLRTQMYYHGGRYLPILFVRRIVLGEALLRVENCIRRQSVLPSSVASRLICEEM